MEPKIGQLYYSGFESDIEDDVQLPRLTIKEVAEQEIQSDGKCGFTILASDNTWYDCFWSEKFKIWVYSLD